MTTQTQNDAIALAFGSLAADVQAELRAIASPTAFVGGELLIREGEVGDDLFVVVSGTVGVVLESDDEPTFSDPMGPGSIVGEMSLLTGEPRRADVVALSDVRGLRIAYGPLRALMTREPAVASLLTVLLGERLGRRGGIRRVGPYQITGRLGDGGFAKVFVGRRTASGRPVAIKMLRHELVFRPGAADRFLSEASVLRKISHPNVVRVEAIVEAYATFFIAMELVDGSDLHEVVRSRGPLSTAEGRSVFLELAAALDHVHSAGIVHLDVKPPNVLITRSGTAKLADFGIALADRGASSAGTRRFFGTPQYASPEHVRGKPLDGRADQFMLAVTMFHALTGRLPGAGRPAQEVMQQRAFERVFGPADLALLDPAFEHVLERCTRLNAAERYPTCLEAAADLMSDGGPVAPVLLDARPSGPSGADVGDDDVPFETFAAQQTVLEFGELRTSGSYATVIADVER